GGALGVCTGHIEPTATIRDNCARGSRAVPPVNRRGEIAGDGRGVGVGEVGDDRAGDCGAFGAGDVHAAGGDGAMRDVGDGADRLAGAAGVVNRRGDQIDPECSVKVIAGDVPAAAAV